MSLDSPAKVLRNIKMVLLAGRADWFAAVLVVVLSTGCSEDSSVGGGGNGGDDPAAGNGPAGGNAQAGGNVGGDSSGGGASGSCIDVSVCDAAYPDLGAVGEWVHSSSSIAATSFANHRGRDMFYNPGESAWVMAKFGYGLFDKDIKDEDIDVYLNRGCGDQWQLLDTVRSTNDGDHATVEGVEDTGGWVFFDATSLALEEGRHRFLFVVAGDHTSTEAYVDIVAPGTPLIVTDVDGTLTISETEEFAALLTGSLPAANADAATILSDLAAANYRVFYLTSRPHFLVGRTREFLDANQFPLGLVHTTLTLTGATGEAATDFKTMELAALAARGLVPSWAFGNTATDADAYANAGIGPDDHRVFFKFSDDAHQSRRIEAYGELLGEISQLTSVECP